MASLIFGIVLLSCLLMGAWYIIAGVKDFLFGGKRPVKDKERLASVMAQLRQEGFFNARDEWTVVKNRILSEVLSEASKHEGFFWNVSKNDVYIKENPGGGQYDTILVYGNNGIGFNWRGQL